MAVGRSRSRDKHLPPRMQRKGRAYYYTPFVDGKLRWIKLGSNYAAAVAEWAKREGAHRSGETVGDAMSRYITEILPSKSEKTQRLYHSYTAKLRAVFGDCRLSGDVSAPDIYRYLSDHPAKVQANREI